MNTGTTPADTDGNRQLTQAEVQLATDRLRSEQNMPAGVIAGLIAALVGAGAWALVVVLTNYQTGLMAIAIGFLVGFAVRTAGKGIDAGFGVVGAALALIGCAAGNLLTVVYIISAQRGSGFLEELARLDAGLAADIMRSTFTGMDLVFYGIAVYFGYRYSIKPVTADDLARALGKPAL